MMSDEEIATASNCQCATCLDVRAARSVETREAMRAAKRAVYPVADPRMAPGRTVLIPASVRRSAE